MHDQLCCAHQQLQKQQEAFFQSAQMISSLKMQLASHQHKPAISQPPSDSSVGNMLTPVTPTNSRPTMTALDTFGSKLFQPGPEDDMDLLLPLETDKVVSPEFERQYCSRYYQYAGKPLPEPVTWMRAIGSQAVRVPTVGGNIELACLGRGKGGAVTYVEALMADGRVVAGAAKIRSFEGRRVALALAELEGLLAMQGKPQLVQCLAACGPAACNGHQTLSIIMEACNLAAAAPPSPPWWCAGPYNERPVHMDITPSYAAPEMLLGILIQRGGDSCRHAIDARGQDIFSLGCFVFNQLTHEHLFPLDPNETPANCLTELCRQHWLWEATYDGAEATAVSTDVHPKLKVLRDYLADDAEYESICRVLRRMLHPNLHSRCTIHAVLASPLCTPD